MDNERALKIELRRALDEVLPPAPWLESAVREDIRKRRSNRAASRTRGKSRTVWPRSAMPFAAAMVIVVVAAAAVAAFLDLRFSATRVAPAAMGVTAYQAMVSRDDGELIIASSDDCSTLQSPCPAAKIPDVAALHRWLDDLDRSTPPARFAVIDAQLRRHLASNISDFNTILAAYQARDQTALGRANYAMQIGANWLDAVAAGFRNSHQGTVAAYVASVRAGEQNLGACTSCQSLGSGAQIVCAGDQAMSCLYEIAYAEAVIAEFEASLVRETATDSVTAADGLLQKDLASADTALLASTGAVLTGDQAGFDASRLLLRKAQVAINADIAGILGG
jgi:hypothetical protein